MAEEETPGSVLRFEEKSFVLYRQALALVNSVGIHCFMTT